MKDKGTDIVLDCKHLEKLSHKIIQFIHATTIDNGIQQYFSRWNAFMVIFRRNLL